MSNLITSALGWEKVFCRKQMFYKIFWDGSINVIVHVNVLGLERCKGVQMLLSSSNAKITLMLPSQKIYKKVIFAKLILINIFLTMFLHIVPNKFFTYIFYISSKFYWENGPKRILPQENSNFHQHRPVSKFLKNWPCETIFTSRKSRFFVTSPP